MKKPASSFWWGSLGVLFVTALLWHFITHYAYKSVWVDLGPTPEARNNIYFGAQKFLEKKGYDVKTSGLLAEVLGRLEPSDTLFLFYDHGMEYESLTGEINDWVKSGGHLVLTVHYLWDEDNHSSGDPYLDQLGVRQSLWPPEDKQDQTEETPASGKDTDDQTSTDGTDVSVSDAPDTDASGTSTENAEASLPGENSNNDDNANDAGQDAASTTDSVSGAESTNNDANSEEKIVPLKNLNHLDDNQENDTDDAPQCDADNLEDVTLLPLSQGMHPLRLAFDASYHIEDVSGNAHAAFTAPPAHMLEYTLGAGRITVLTDYFLFNDGNIGAYDHAFFLWWLANTSPRVWFVYDKYADTLMSLLWSSAPYLCVAVLLALGAWLLYRGRRFGPIVSIEHANRRQLQEHIDASTTFLWRAEEQPMLLEEARQLVLNKCPLVNGQISKTPRLMRAMENLEIDDARLLWALTTTSVADEAEFVELIRLLQQLRMNL